MTHHSTLDFSSAADWYDHNAQSFSAASLSIDTSALLDRFAHGLAPDARVLDLGCGAGRDAQALLERGFAVEAVDASAEMCAHTEKLTQGRARVRQARIEDLPQGHETWDGIWMMASLLHLPRADWAGALARLIGALNPGGRLYLSVKDGEGEELDPRGRPMAHAGAGDLADLLRGIAPERAQIEIWKTQTPASGGEIQVWINALVVLG
tara:strand:+ start:680 stop:1306 length:627 start_codon:yes stop_codon:yes gene_type:complete